MATYGEHRTTGTAGSSTWQTIFAWERTGYSIADNTSTIYWELRIYRTNPAALNGTYIYEKGSSVTIDGAAVHSNSTNTKRVTNKTEFVIASGTKLLSHNSDGSKTFSVTYNAQLYSTSTNIGATTSFTLDSIPRQANITSATNIVVDASLATGATATIAYSNPAGNAVTSLMTCISWTGGADIAYRPIDVYGTSYTYNFTGDEMRALCASCPNSETRTVTFYVTTVIGGVTYYSTLQRTLKLTNTEPTLTASAQDVGGVSTTLTGNGNTMIKGFNYITASMTPSLKTGATLVSQSISNGGTVVNAASAGFNNAENNTFVFSITDSRGKTASQTITLNMIPWIRVTCNLETNNPTVDGDMAFKIYGNYYNGSFGAVNNTLSVKWRYKENDGEYGDWVDVTPTISGNSYSVTVHLTGLSYQSNYTFQAVAYDAIVTTGVFTPEKKVKTVPVFDWGENDFTVNGDLNVTGKIDYPVNAMTIGLINNSALTISPVGTFVQIPFDTIQRSYGNKLTFSNYSIIIGKKVSYIRVSGNFLTRGIVGNQLIRILHNGTTVMQGCYTASNANDWDINSFSPIVLAVTEGDTISVTTSSDTIAGTITVSGRTFTYLTVEVIK